MMGMLFPTLLIFTTSLLSLTTTLSAETHKNVSRGTFLLFGAVHFQEQLIVGL
jgi:hypothetical protein